MGGCYSGSYDYRDNSTSANTGKSRTYGNRSGNYKSLIKDFFKTQNNESLVGASNSFFGSNSSGFILEVAKAAGINDVNEIPKEFPEIEYEVKFGISPRGKGDEPSVVEYMDAFEFPCGRATRFFKDPVNTSAVGVNNFYGDLKDERLVVIEKGGNIYLKEKGLVTPVVSNVPYSEVVIKRTEKRYPASFEEASDKVAEVLKEPGVRYRGKIRKEKGDFFVLDSNSGRIFSYSLTRAHLVKPGETEETGTQRQLEIEYAGFIPGFPNFEHESENDVVQGMVDNARYTFGLYGNVPVGNGWRADLRVTDERKYDFIIGKKVPRLERTVRLPMIGSNSHKGLVAKV